jgi:hypothetical protein
VKFLTLFFSVYILLLPGFPCSDVAECFDDSKIEIANKSTNHNNHQHENDGCNPFCSCACCGQVLFPNHQLNNVVTLKPIENLRQQFFYKNIFISSDFFGNIWQPPKLS